MRFLRRVFCNVRWHTLVAGDMIVSRKVYGFAVNQGGTTDFIRPGQNCFLSGIFIFGEVFLCFCLPNDGVIHISFSQIYNGGFL